jgi:hypothetical protein
MGNILIELIKQGKIQSLDGLRRTYRKIVMKTHPDAIGTDALLGRYLEFSQYYEEAKDYLQSKEEPAEADKNIGVANHRLAFFQQLNIIETLEMPYAFHPDQNEEKLAFAKREGRHELRAWRPEWAELYVKAERQLSAIKHSKPMGPYMKHALGLNLRPLLHNLIAFHLTGKTIYGKMAKQNLSGIMHRLEEEGYGAAKEFLSLLIGDLQNGPAIFTSEWRRIGTQSA